MHYDGLISDKKEKIYDFLWHIQKEEVLQDLHRKNEYHDRKEDIFSHLHVVVNSGGELHVDLDSHKEGVASTVPDLAEVPC